MLTKAFPAIGACFVLSSAIAGCGQSSVAATSAEPSTVIPNTVSATVPGVLPNPHLSAHLPTFPSDVLANLKALPAPDPLAPAKAPVDIPVTQAFQGIDCGAAATWLGGELPTLPGLDSSAYAQFCATDWRGSLPTGNMMSNGQPVELTLYRYYTPKEVDLANVMVDRAPSAGISFTSVYVGPNLWPPITEVSDTHNIVGGLMTVSLPQGLAAVQNFGSLGTIVNWKGQSSRQAVDVSARIAAAPATAVQIAASGQ